MSGVRNFCMLAHVDHGKTTMTDFLIASNGIISTASAGKLRYMDSREDEQERQITMKASSISLSHVHNSHRYVLNLVDCPGHIDFSSEVSAAARLCDGGLVLVDVVDGPNVQTQIVLQQAYRERLRVCLVLNKIDLLYTKMDYSAGEAYSRLLDVLTSVNVIMSSLMLSEGIAAQADATATTSTEDADFLEDDDGTDDWFSPEKGNVAFASARDGWAFRVQDFAKMFSAKFKMNEKVLTRAFWGEKYLHTKKGAVSIKRKPPVGKESQPCMFVQSVMEPVWKVYREVFEAADADTALATATKLAEKLNVTCDFSRTKKQQRAMLETVLGAWLPLQVKIPDMVIEQLPSPVEAQKYRAPLLLPDLYSMLPTISASTWAHPNATKDKEKDVQRDDDIGEIPQLRRALESCDRDSQFNVAFVAKMIDVPPCLNSPIGPEAAGTLGLCRVFSGSLKKGAQIDILEPRYNPSFPDKFRATVTIQQLYIMQGPAFSPIDRVPCGHICCVAGLHEHVIKSATLSSTPRCSSFIPLALSTPIMRIAVRPMNATELPQLLEGLKKLNRVDPQVELELANDGRSQILCVCGEVHAQRCLRDLNEAFAQIEIEVDPPSVAVKETIVTNSTALLNTSLSTDNIEGSEQDSEQPQTDEGLPECTTLDSSNDTIYVVDRFCDIKLKATSLPAEICKCVEEHQADYNLMHCVNKNIVANDSKQQALDRVDIFLQELKGAFKRCGWGSQWKHTWAWSEKRPNLLLNRCKHFCTEAEWDHFADRLKNVVDAHLEQSTPQRAVKALQQGFERICNKGPMCQEPISNVCFVIYDVQFHEEPEDDSTVEQIKIEDENRKKQDDDDDDASAADAQHDKAKSNSSRGLKHSYEDNIQILNKVLTTTQRPEAFFWGLADGMTAACSTAFAAQPQRLIEPILHCHIMVTGEAGRIYGIIHERRGDVLDDVLVEGTDMQRVTCQIPAANSFGLADELRKKMAGASQCQLRFSHWQVLDVDPYWVPVTEDEKEEFGDDGQASSVNVAAELIQKVCLCKRLVSKTKLDAEKLTYSRAL